MAVAGMRTQFGARVAARWHDGAVRVTVDDEAEAVAFALPRGKRPGAAGRAVGPLGDYLRGRHRPAPRKVSDDRGET